MHTNCNASLKTAYKIYSKMRKFTEKIVKSCMDLTQLLIGIFERFFHFWKADIVADVQERYTGKSWCAGVISATQCWLSALYVE